MRLRENVRQVVPFFLVANMAESVRYYVEGLGFEMSKHWIDDGKLRWCWLELGGAALMLQEHSKEGPETAAPLQNAGQGVSLYFICADALEVYHQARSKDIQAETPFVGNGMWVTGLTDPDGYQLFFESDTDAAEGTVFREAQTSADQRTK